MTSPFGLLAFLHWNHDWNNFHFDQNSLEKAIIQLKELNIKNIRMDILWSDIYRPNNPNDYSKYDKLINKLYEEGFSLLCLLHYNKVRLSANGEELWNRPPDSFEEFGDYVFETVSRYKKKISYWEIWNEPNHPVYWSLPPDQLKTYSKLLSISYKAAKKADPTCFVLNGGITEPVIENIEYLYQQGGKDMTDILSVHLFVDPQSPNKKETFKRWIASIHEIKKRYGDSHKKIWITELGCPGMPKDTQIKWFGGDVVSEQEQADWLNEIFQIQSETAEIERIYWAFYRDTEKMFNDGADFLGIVRNDFSPKPAYHKLKELIKIHAGK
ncbi:MAG: family 1 glycosylhydrolase [Elusimicrobiota bacterium]